MDAGVNPCQNMKRLIKLRNALVHFKPEWQAHDVANKVEKDLKGVSLTVDFIPVFHGFVRSASRLAALNGPAIPASRLWMPGAARWESSFTTRRF